MFRLHNPVVGRIGLTLRESDTPSVPVRGVVLDHGAELMYLLELEESTLFGIVMRFFLVEVLLWNVFSQPLDVGLLYLLLYLEEVLDSLGVIERQVFRLPETSASLASVEAIFQGDGFAPSSAYDDDTLVAVVI